MFDWRAGQPHHDDSRDDKSEQTNDQPKPISTPDKIKSTEHDAHPQQYAAEKPKRRRKKSRPAKVPPSTRVPEIKDYSLSSSVSSCMALSSLATQCHAFKQPTASPTTSSASVYGCLPG